MHSSVTRSFGHARCPGGQRCELPPRRIVLTRIVTNLIFGILTVAALCRTGRAAGADPQAAQITAQKTYTLTVVVEGVRNSTGEIGMLMFNSRQGWPDELKDALRGTRVPAVAGKTTVKVDSLAPGDYGVLVIHDENLNQKLDRDWKGLPSEQWGMSNNPRVYLSAPTFERARFHLTGDMEIHITLK